MVNANIKPKLQNHVAKLITFSPVNVQSVRLDSIYKTENVLTNLLLGVYLKIKKEIVIIVQENII